MPNNKLKTDMFTFLKLVSLTWAINEIELIKQLSRLIRIPNQITNILTPA